MKLWAAALLAASALAGTPALAQSTQAPDAARTAEIEALRAQLRALEARLATLENRTVPAQEAHAPAHDVRTAAPDPARGETFVRFSGAPRITQGDWSFKPRGRIQLDAGYLWAPDGVADPGLGFGARLRRGRLGVEGDMPGGFGYRAEVDIAGGEVSFTDLFLTYAPSDVLTLTLGQHDNFQGLERQTSSNFTSFMERAGFTNAFNFERRLGLSATWAEGDWRVQAGVFADDLDSLGDRNGSWSIDARLVFAPEVAGTQLHFGGSAHYRDQSELAGTGAGTRYRHRPALRTTDVRFIATPSLPVETETHGGVEAALVRGPWHAAAEAHWLRADTRLGPAPTFFGAYAEIGWFLTGESRGYRDGSFNRTRVFRPLGDGGFGALQVNLRYDRLDLNDDGITGGTQDALLASLIWIPQDHVRFLLNGGWLWYEDAALPSAGGDRSYAVPFLGTRAQIDF